MLVYFFIKRPFPELYHFKIIFPVLVAIPGQTISAPISLISHRIVHHLTVDFRLTYCLWVCLVHAILCPTDNFLTFCLTKKWLEIPWLLLAKFLAKLLRECDVGGQLFIHNQSFGHQPSKGQNVIGCQNFGLTHGHEPKTPYVARKD